MKKILPFAAAVMTAASAIPYCPKAAEEMNVKNIPHLISYHPLELEHKTVEYINNRNLDIDFNSDGKFDHFDCYLLDRYDDYPGSNDYLPENIREKIKANSDLDGDGETDAREKGCILCHFLLYCDIDTSFFAQSTYEAYDNELGIKHGPSYNGNKFGMQFVDSLNDRSIFIGVHYLFLEKMIEEGKVNPDINNDGKFDMSDVVDFTIASTYEPCISEQDPNTGLWTYTSCPDKKIVLDEEIKARAKKITLEQSEYKFIQNYDASALLDCLFMREPVLPEYSDNKYYEKFYENAQYYSIGEMVENYREYIVQDSAFQPLMDEIEKQNQEKEVTKNRFYDEIAAGKATVPDLNFDNTIDGRDLRVAEIYHGDISFGRTAEESSLTKEEYDNIAQNCDYDHNGISGDDGDYILIFDYICKVVDERTTAMATDSTGEFYKQYADALFIKEMNPDEKPNSSYDPFHLYDDSGEKFEFPTLEEHYESYVTRVAMKMSSRPDIDGNGIVDERDKKYAESYASYIATGEMGDTEIPEDVMERIKNECDFTGDGKSGLLYDMQVAALYIDRIVLKNSAQSEIIIQPEGKRSGDANCDDELSMADSVLIMQSLANPDKYGINGTDEKHITEQGIENADIAGNNDGITSTDALAVQLILLGLDQI